MVVLLRLLEQPAADAALGPDPDEAEHHDHRDDERQQGQPSVGGLPAVPGEQEAGEQGARVEPSAESEAVTPTAVPRLLSNQLKTAFMKGISVPPAKKPARKYGT
ncbi:hypothetical protein GCM10020295_79250 [Streptomyces cinereospinus]